MHTPFRLILAFFLTWFGCLPPLSAQTPRVYLKFDGDLTDSSVAGIVTTISPSAGFTPTYTTDHNGVANGAIFVCTMIFDRSALRINQS